MLRILFVFIFILASTSSFAQDDFEKALDSIQTLDDVNIFFKKNKKAKGKVIVFNEEKHKTRMAEKIFKMSVGSKKYFKDSPQKTYFKVIEKYEIPYYRVSCVYLDGNKKSIDDIKSIRNTVMSKYAQGYRFEDLARQYSMDRTAKQGGDTGWFTEGDMHPDFESAIINGSHQVDDMFTLDIPDTKSYYVVLVTENKKLIEEAKVLKVTEPMK